MTRRVADEDTRHADNRGSKAHADRGGGSQSPRTDAEGAVTRVIEWIKSAVRAGDLAPGQRLVEADLVARLGVKRWPVREALRVLAGDGIVELVHQKGARVRRLTPADIADMIPVLAGLTSVSVRLAIPRLTAAELRELDRCMQQVRGAARLQDFGQFQVAGMHYQSVLQRSGSNPFLVRAAAALHPDLFHRQFAASLRIENWSTYLEHFEAMHTAILKRNVAQALRLIGEHAEHLAAAFERGESSAVWR